MNNNTKQGYFSTFILKITAIISMLTDHAAVFLVDATKYPDIYGSMREIGRLAFPIFCFLLVEGYFRTHNVKKYMLRLSIFAIISEIPFDLMYNNKMEIFNHQNVFFTLAIGLAVIWYIDTNKDKKFMQGLVIFTGCIAAFILRTDYTFWGIIQIMIFYYFRYIRWYRISGITILNFAMGQPAGAISLFLTENYNGLKGISCKYLFYIFYPLHLIILHLIRMAV